MNQNTDALRLVTNLIHAVHARAREHPTAPAWGHDLLSHAGDAPWHDADLDLEAQADHLLDLLPRSPTDLSVETLTSANVERCEDSYHPLDEWSLCDWATAAAGEMGEVCGVVKKLRRISSDDEAALDAFPDQLLALSDEIADAVIYLDLLATRAGINLASAIRRKFNETSETVGSAVRL